MKAVIIGQGYVGLPLAQAAVGAGISVVGLESKPETVDALNAGKSHVGDISDSALVEMLNSGYGATADVTTIADADVVVICVPTPLGDQGVPDLTYVTSAATQIAENLTAGTLVVLESTTYPGTTEEVVQPILEQSGLALDTGFHLAFSPERIDPGNPTFGLRNTPKVVGGATPASTRAAAEFYGTFIETVVTTRGTREAETAKLLENTYRHVNIALVNEMARFCHDLGIDLWNVIDAAATKPFGFQAFYPGPGVGGHCIPIDPNYLSYEVQRKLGYPFRFVELAESINDSMPAYVVDRVQDALNDVSKPIKGSSVLLLGVTYKANVKDQRESPARPIAELLAAKGARLSYHDPRVARWTTEIGELESETDLEAAVAAADVVMLLQAHREYDVDALAELAQLFFDTRGKSTIAKAIRL
ncbi:MAG: nucleotide sugar dehydrogenase [Actinobacteria bacterium]|nr:nucleotide sugar dehydrogenase [Actinomycetota bacterium]